MHATVFRKLLAWLPLVLSSALAAAAAAALLAVEIMPKSPAGGTLPALTALQSELAQRLRRHVEAIASSEHNTSTPAALENAARYIEATLAAEGYRVRRQQYNYGGHTVRNLEVTISNAVAGQAPRILIVGAHYDSAPGAPGANDNGSGTAAVLELARLLKAMRPAPGTELRFVLFTNEEPPWFMSEGMGSWRHAQELHERGAAVEAALILETIGYYSSDKNSQQYPPGLAKFYPDTGNFLAFVGITESSALVRRTLAAFRATGAFPAEGLAAPGAVQGVTLSDHTSYNAFGYPALMITDTAFLRYPHYHSAQDTPDKVDYASVARIVTGLAQVIETMAQAGQKQASGL